MDYDVIIIGGALAGSAAADLLLRRDPTLRVIVIEKSLKFGRRVGEATVEVSGYFLGRMLGLTRHLNNEHLVKQGMRFWFSNEETRTLEDAGEIGGRFLARLPAYQLDRAVIDEEVLRQAVANGAHLLRPAVAESVRLTPGGTQEVIVRKGEMRETLRARWILDASGVGALLSRQEGWFRQNDEHPTAACWARWRGVKDWDSRELAEKFPAWSARAYGIRSTATNHVVGDGWWSWWIPLRGGDVSVGVVFDQRLVAWEKGDRPLGDRLKDFLVRHPVGAEMLADAEPVAGDVHWRKNLAYSSTKYAGDGFVLIGDAGAFLDPFYSPGMDWLSFTTYSAVDVILRARAGESVPELAAAFDKKFQRSYRRWFEAVYKDKYEYVGEFDLMKIAFHLDLCLYYFGIASQPYKVGAKSYLEPPFNSPHSAPFQLLMKSYNAGLARIARARRKRGMLARANNGHSHIVNGFTFSPRDLLTVFRPLANWMRIALKEA